MLFSGKPSGGASLDTLRRVLVLSALVWGVGLGIAPYGSPAATLKALNDLGTCTISDWKEVVSREGAFRLSFPTEPKEGKRTLETAAGKLISTSYILEEGPISFFASWLEFPPMYVQRVGEVDILNGAKEAFFKRFKGKFDKERIIRLEAAPGRDVTYRTEDDVRFRLRIFLRGNKLVQTMVMAEPEYIDSADANRFLDSLKWD